MTCAHAACTGSGRNPGKAHDASATSMARSSMSSGIMAATWVWICWLFTADSLSQPPRGASADDGKGMSIPRRIGRRRVSGTSTQTVIKVSVFAMSVVSAVSTEVIDSSAFMTRMLARSFLRLHGAKENHALLNQ